MFPCSCPHSITYWKKRYKKQSALTFIPGWVKLISTALQHWDPHGKKSLARFVEGDSWPPQLSLTPSEQHPAEESQAAHSAAYIPLI
jgi:hypothetical protein